MNHFPTVITVRFRAYHTTRPLSDVVSVLGRAELERSIDDDAGEDDGTPLTVWVREIVPSTSTDPLTDAASWMIDHNQQVEQLCLDNWELHLDIDMVARDPISSLVVPHRLMQEVSRHQCLSLEFSVYPKPNLMP